MRRFYLKRTGNSISITNRCTHELLGFASLDDKKKAKKLVLDLANMTTEEYIKYAIGLGARFKSQKTTGFEVSADAESWYEGAWKTTTTFALKELGLKDDIIPDEDITPELVKEVMQNINSPKGASVSAKKPLPKKAHVDDVKQVEEIQKQVKPLPKKKEQQKQPYTKEILQNLLASGKITAKQYREEMMKLRGTKKLPVKVAK